jgi:hypothetical protein
VYVNSIGVCACVCVSQQHPGVSLTGHCFAPCVVTAAEEMFTDKYNRPVLRVGAEVGAAHVDSP